MQSRWPLYLTLSRIAAAPIVGGLVLWAHNAAFAQGFAFSAQLYLAAALVFILAAITDFLDGWLARKLGAVTPLGAALDHVADKALVTAALVALSYALLRWELVAAAIILLVRDVAVAGLREGLSASGRSLPVSQTGKLKAGAEMVAIAALLLLPPAQMSAWGLSGALTWIAQIGLWSAVFLALWSAALYVRAALRPQVPPA